LGSSKFVDGALIDSLPALRALAFGCKRILVISTRELTYRSTSEKAFVGRLARIAGVVQRRNVRCWLGLPNPLVDANLEFLSACDSGLVGQGSVFVISPSDPKRLVGGWTDITADRIHECAQMGYEDAAAAKSRLLDWLTDA
jgi:predicted patatin/cPLA2 family phospholipase